MKKLILTTVVAVLLFSVSNVSGQINDKIYGKPEDYKAMLKRPLIVELQEESPKVIEKLSKNEKKADQLRDYKAFISEYNAMIREAVEKYWTINENIEYKNHTEVEALLKAKSTKYTILAYTELSDSDDNIASRSGLEVPALIYHRTEKSLRMPDYKIYLPSSFIREEDKYLPCDFKFALMQMQSNIQYNIKNNVTLNFEDYAKKMMLANCSGLAKNKLLVEKDFLYKSVTEAEAKEGYGKNLVLTDAKTLNNSYMDGTEGEAVLFALPFGIIKGQMGPISSSALAFIKVVINSSTGEIYYIHLPKMGTSYVYQLLKGEFGKMAACK